jgi:hypothetical protein
MRCPSVWSSLPHLHESYQRHSTDALVNSHQGHITDAAACALLKRIYRSCGSLLPCIRTCERSIIDVQKSTSSLVVCVFPGASVTEAFACLLTACWSVGPLHRAPLHVVSSWDAAERLLESLPRGCIQGSMLQGQHIRPTGAAWMPHADATTTYGLWF